MSDETREKFTKELMTVVELWVAASHYSGAMLEEHIQDTTMTFIDKWCPNAKAAPRRDSEVAE